MGMFFWFKVFYDVWFGDMVDNGLIDYVQVIKQFVVCYLQIDLECVGIYGYLGGGFFFMGVILRFFDFFKVVVLSVGNYDQCSYFFVWGEKYQGFFEMVEDGLDNYQLQVNYLLVVNLKGKLLLIYGMFDDNVYFNGMLLFIDELIKYNKDFDMFVLFNWNYCYVNEFYVICKMWDYFVEYLFGEILLGGYKIEDFLKD